MTTAITESNAIVNVGPAMTIQEAVARRNSLVEFTQTIMVKDVDYGVIPGSSKPTLLKPGAEKLRTFFNINAPTTLTDKIEDWDKGLFYYRYRTEVVINGCVVAACEGSANSKEKKYRYRNIFEWDLKPGEKEKAISVIEKEKRNGSGKYKVYQFENTEPFDLINTLQKMAQKRSFVGAILLGANASEFFTQDVEDMDFIDGHFTDAVQEPAKPTVKINPVADPSAMTYEQACEVTSSKNEKYGDLPSDTLSHMLNAMNKKMSDGKYTAEEADEMTVKMHACHLILTHRAETGA